jgi:hypothetical protein
MYNITVSTHPRLPDVDAKVHCIVLMYVAVGNLIVLLTIA